MNCGNDHGPTSPSNTVQKPPWTNRPVADPAASATTEFWALDSASHGLIRPSRKNRKHSSPTTSTLGVRIDANSVATVDFPAPDRVLADLQPPEADITTSPQLAA